MEILKAANGNELVNSKTKMGENAEKDYKVSFNWCFECCYTLGELYILRLIVLIVSVAVKKGYL